MTKPKNDIWRSRIVGHEDVDPSQLLAHELNFRRHPGPQQNALSGLIEELGFTSPVLVQQSSGKVIDGHLRVELALRQNQPTIPVTYLDLTDAEAALALATTDPISAMAYADADQLRALLDEVSTSDAAVMQMLSDLAESNGVIPPNTFDANAEWQGMPEFEHDDRTPAKQVIVNFASESDVERFARMVEQNVMMTTKSIWYPATERTNVRDMGYVSDEA